MSISSDVKRTKILQQKIKNAEKELYDHIRGMHIHCPVKIGDEVQCNRGGNKGEILDIDNLVIIRHGSSHAFMCNGRIKRTRRDGTQTHSRGEHLILFKDLENK